jgi:hypothetical protein
MFKKPMSEDRIGSQTVPRDEGHGLPEPNRRGNRVCPHSWAFRRPEILEKVAKTGPIEPARRKPIV